MFSVWTVVKPASETHDRAGEVGMVWKTNQAKMPDHVVVKWDADGTEESVALADLVENR